jgi:hypothetical protein
VARPEDDAFDEDDAALTWVGDEEQGRATPRLGSTGDPQASDAAAIAEGDDDEEVPGSGGRRAATIGFAVPYLALAIGWVFAVQYAPGPTQLFPAILWQFGEFLAMLSAPLWFAATLHLTAEQRPRVRAGWLALGVVVLLPWPIIVRFLSALQFAGSVS